MNDADDSRLIGMLRRVVRDCGKLYHHCGTWLVRRYPTLLEGREDSFVELMDDLCAYQASSRPARGSVEVVMPGAYDFRTRAKRLREGIPVDPQTWRQIAEAARRLNVPIPDPPAH